MCYATSDCCKTVMLMAKIADFVVGFVEGIYTDLLENDFVQEIFRKLYKNDRKRKSRKVL